MRRSREEAAETRTSIVKAAADQFRENGLQSTSLAELMSAAGLTHGGFYRHFESKDAVAAEAIAVAARELNQALTSAIEGKSGSVARSSALKSYLSRRHRNNLRNGCPLAALGSEIVHTSKLTRSSASKGYEDMVGILEGLYPDLDRNSARQRAIAVACGLIGALTMARIVPDTDLSDEVLTTTASVLARI